MRMDKLEEQTRFTNTRLTDYGNHLTMACSCLFKCFSKLLGFSIAPDKASEAARGCGLQPRTRRTQRQ